MLRIPSELREKLLTAVAPSTKWLLIFGERKIGIRFAGVEASHGEVQRELRGGDELLPRPQGEEATSAARGVERHEPTVRVLHSFGGGYPHLGLQVQRGAGAAAAGGCGTHHRPQAAAIPACAGRRAVEDVHVRGDVVDDVRCPCAVRGGHVGCAGPHVQKRLLGAQGPAAAPTAALLCSGGVRADGGHGQRRRSAGFLWSRRGLCRGQPFRGFAPPVTAGLSAVPLVAAASVGSRAQYVTNRRRRTDGAHRTCALHQLPRLTSQVPLTSFPLNLAEIEICIIPRALERTSFTC